MNPPPPAHYRYPRTHRLSGERAYEAVFSAKVRKNMGPLSVYGMPNGLTHPRLGLSVSRRVGTAVVRNRIKRLVREAFRLCQHDWPAGYDLVVVVHRHEPAGLADYQRLLFGAVRSVHLEWQRRQRRTTESPPPGPPAGPASLPSPPVRPSSPPSTPSSPDSDR